MDEAVSMGLAGIGILLALIGLWAAWRLLADHGAALPIADGPVGEAAGELPGNRASREPHAPSAHARLDAPASVPASPAEASMAAAGPAQRERLVCLVARHDKVIQSPITGVYINLGKCFEDLGFQVQRAISLAALETLLADGVPGVMGVDCRLGPRTLREIARLARQFPALRGCVFLFYNAERPEALTPPAILPHAHFLGLAFSSQQVMEILAPAFEFESVGAAEGRKESGAIFEGILSENSLPEILQFLEIGRRTGLLSLEDDQPAGVINFDGGDIISAQTHLHEGADAVMEMLALTKGKFRFFPGKVTGPTETRLSATQVLMHWAQRVDETGEMVARQDGSLLDSLT